MPKKKVNPFKEYNVLSNVEIPSSKKPIKLEDTELFRPSHAQEKIKQNLKKQSILPNKKSLKSKELKEEPLKIPTIEQENNLIKIKDNYFRVINDVSDKLAPLQTMPEEIVYNRLYRLSYGFNKNTCRVGYREIIKHTSVQAKNAVKKAINGLIKKNHIHPIYKYKKEFDTNKEGTLYRIHLPHEILKKNIENPPPSNLNSYKSTTVSPKDTGSLKDTVPQKDTRPFNDTVLLKNTVPFSDPRYHERTQGGSLNDTVRGHLMVPSKKKPPNSTLKINRFESPFFLKDSKEQLNNNRDDSVVVSFFNQRFRNYQNTLNAETANLLLKNHDLNKILICINRIPIDGSIRNPAGLLCKALNNSWELAPTKEEIYQNDKIAKKEEYNAKQEKEQIEKENFEKAEAQARTEEERTNKLFDKLSEKEKSKLQERAIEELISEYPDVSQNVFKNIIARKTMVMIKIHEIIKSSAQKVKI